MYRLAIVDDEAYILRQLNTLIFKWHIDQPIANPDLIAGLHEQTNLLASIFGKEAEATEALAAIDAKVADLQEKTADAGTGLVILTSGGEVTAIAPGGLRGMLIYGAGIGIITILIRVWGAYPEGMSFAILIMNAVVPLINKYVKPKRFGAAAVR